MRPPIDHDPTDRFPTDPSGLAEAGRPELLELAAGGTLELRVGPGLPAGHDNGGRRRPRVGGGEGV